MKNNPFRGDLIFMSRFVIAMGVSILLVACAVQRPATKEAVPKGPVEEVVAQRAVERWNHIIAGDFDAAYECLTRGAKAVVSREEYALRLGQSQVKWIQARTLKVECENESACQTQVELDIRVLVPRAGEILTKTHLQEDWLLDSTDSQWRYLPGQAR